MVSGEKGSRSLRTGELRNWAAAAVGMPGGRTGLNVPKSIHIGSRLAGTFPAAAPCPNLKKKMRERKLKLLDLFCKAGGAAMGYHRAGFEVVGVDIDPQPRYPFEFHQADALTYPLDGFDVIHASPPCQAYCALKTMRNKREHPELINSTRDKLNNSGKPWIIENVFGSPLVNPIMLCGSHFNCNSGGYYLRRHRYFESNFLLLAASKCSHNHPTVGVYGCKARDIAKEKRHYAKPKETRGKPIGVVLSKEIAFGAMGIDWMNQKELSQAIPPAYSEFIGRQLFQWKMREEN